MSFLNTNGFALPVYVVKGIYNQGHIADIGPLQIAIVDKQTNYVATASGNGKEFILVGGSPHTKDQIAKFYKGMKSRKEATPFFGKDVEYFEKVAPSRVQNEAWVLGFDGSSSSKSLRFEADSVYRLRVRLFGDKVFRNSQASLDKIIPLYTGCANVDDCDESCAPPYVGVKKQTRAWAKAIMENPELAEYKIKVTPLFSDYAATASSKTDYTLTIGDDGSGNALQDVQRFYGNQNIARTSYARGISVYTLPAQTAKPADYVSKTYSVPVTNCDECTVGTFTDSVFTYVVKTPVAPTTDLDDAAARTAFAASIVTSYGGTTGTGLYLGLDEGTAVVKFNATAAKTAKNADVLEQIAFTMPTCTTVAGVTTAWIAGQGSYTVTRTLTATFSTEDCDAAVSLADIQKHLSVLKNTVVVTDITGSDSCTKTYQVVQSSFPMRDEYCLGSDVARFEDVPSYKDSYFVEVDVPETYNPSIKAGLRFDAPFYSDTFGDFSYEVDERWDNQPLRMEISVYDNDLQICKLTDEPKGRRIRLPKYERLSGKYVRREYIQRNSEYFAYEKWNINPRDREILDNNVLSQIRDDVHYVMYQLGYRESRDQHNFNQKKQHWAPILFVEEGDIALQKALEDHFHGVISRFDINLKNRVPVK
jgi:hypothetical protein